MSNRNISCVFGARPHIAQNNTGPFKIAYPLPEKCPETSIPGTRKTIFEVSGNELMRKLMSKDV
jgi:hypothetical protein